jgi:hypothetical protein
VGPTAFLRARPRAAMLLAAALFLRLLVPAGFMVGNAAGVPALVPCPAAAPAPVMVHGGHHHGPVPHAEAPCPFAALAAPALPPADPLALAPPQPGFALASALLPAESPVPGAASPLPPARGPPASV